jgi:hypothetical protein
MRDAVIAHTAATPDLYSLAMTVPVMAFGAGVVTIDILGWVYLGVIILGGIGLIWWATERAWGNFS